MLSDVIKYINENLKASLFFILFVFFVMFTLLFFVRLAIWVYDSKKGRHYLRPSFKPNFRFKKR